MTWTEQVNGTVANANEVNKLALYYDEVTDNTKYSASTTSWETLNTLSSIKSFSSDAYLTGIYLKFDVVANNSSYHLAVKINGTNFGDYYVSAKGSTSTGNFNGLSTSRIAFLSGQISSSKTVIFFIPLPPGIVTGDSTYDVVIEGTRSGTGGAELSVENMTVRLYSSDNLVSELT